MSVFVTTVAGLITILKKQAISYLIWDDFKIVRLVTRKAQDGVLRLWMFKKVPSARTKADSDMHSIAPTSPNIGNTLVVGRLVTLLR